MAITTTFSLSTGRLVLFGDTEAVPDRLFDGGDDRLIGNASDSSGLPEGRADFGTTPINGGDGRDGLTITANSGRVRVIHAFRDEPRYRDDRTRPNQRRRQRRAGIAHRE